MSECIKKWGCPGEDGGERSLIRKMLEMMTTMERDPTVQQVEWGGEVI